MYKSKWSLKIKHFEEAHQKISFARTATLPKAIDFGCI
jgi:hypothetical protein